MFVLSLNERVEFKYVLLSSLVLVASASIFMFFKKKQPPQVKYKKVKRQCVKGLPGGLVNIGNSCYLNSTIQLLAAASEKIESFFARKKSKIGQELISLISRVNDGETVRPIEFISSFASSAVFSSEQQDSHEFLLALLNLSDHEAAVSNHSQLGLKVLGQPTHKFLTAYQVSSFAEEVKATFSTENPFSGALMSEFVCMQCAVRKRQRNISSIRIEPFTCTSIISDKKDLNEAVYEHLCIPERLSDYQNDDCRDKGAVRQKRPLLFPELLLLHLPQLAGLSGWKDTENIPRLQSDELSGPGYRYRLQAIIVHLGSHGSSGHFVCYRRLGPEQWILCNDAKVQQVSFETVLSQIPYILLFEKE